MFGEISFIQFGDDVKATSITGEEVLFMVGDTMWIIISHTQAKNLLAELQKKLK